MKEEELRINHIEKEKVNLKLLEIAIDMIKDKNNQWELSKIDKGGDIVESIGYGLDFKPDDVEILFFRLKDMIDPTLEECKRITYRNEAYKYNKFLSEKRSKLFKE